ncbi:MAG: hypothetical protein KDC49_21665 [Saprospiraceae bacterium]|nr:hypothetical protein [Saprospiraceae bacterium]
MKDLLVEIVIAIRNIVPENFEKVILYVTRFEGTVSFSGDYIDIDHKTHWIDFFNYSIDDGLFQQLYFETQNNSLIHMNWNKAVFILTSDNKLDINYLWDQELQDNVDLYNKDS